MKYDQDNRIHRMVMAGLLAALIMALTIVVAIPIPSLAGAYVNLGDAGVYLAALLLGNPWGALCAAVGSALADLLLGSALYMAPTFFIKGLMALCAAAMLRRRQGKLLLPALASAGLIMPAGYLLFESALYGFGTAVLGLPANLLQYAVGVALGVPLLRLAAHAIPMNEWKNEQDITSK